MTTENVTIPAPEKKSAQPAKKQLDLQDWLLVVGVGSLVGGITAWSRPAGFVAFGLLCLTAVWLMSLPKGKK